MNWSCSGIMMSRGIIQESLQLATLKDRVFCLLKTKSIRWKIDNSGSDRGWLLDPFLGYETNGYSQMVGKRSKSGTPRVRS
jgi:hypothetical protein